MDRFEAEGSYDPLHDPTDDYRMVIDNGVRALAEGAAADRDELLYALPVGWRLCLHDDLRVQTEPDADLASDRVRFKVSQRYHTLQLGEVCDYPNRTEYGPKPALTAEDLEPLRRAVEARNAELDAKITAHRLTGSTAREVAATYADSFDRLLDRATWDAVPGIFAAAPAAPEPDAMSLHDKLREMFKRVSGDGQYRPDPPPIVAPETLRRHREAAELPRAPWIAVRSPFAEGEWLWIKREGGHGPFYFAGALGDIEGRSLFRTGQFIARPDERGGWDVAEVMVTS